MVSSQPSEPSIRKSTLEMCAAGTLAKACQWIRDGRAVCPSRVEVTVRRAGDLPALIDYFLRKQAKVVGKNVTGFTDEARERLGNYNWPGNVREVANVIERAVVLSSGSNITLRNLPSRIAGGEGSGLVENLSYRDGMNAARNLLIHKALSRTQGNRTAAAKLLGLEAKYLLKLMKSLGIE